MDLIRRFPNPMLEDRALQYLLASEEEPSPRDFVRAWLMT